MASLNSQPPKPERGSIKFNQEYNSFSLPLVLSCSISYKSSDSVCRTTEFYNQKVTSR
jgi:hypothetical protein